MAGNGSTQNSAAGSTSPDDLLGGCNGAAVRDRVGRLYTPDEQRLLLQRSGATVLRPLRPGDRISMDFISDRLTVDLDGQGRILALRCG